MFLTKVNLKKNSWHYKLQIRTFGNIPFKDNFCPYFWLSIFCILISPFILLSKGLVLAVKVSCKPFELLVDWINKVICIPRYKSQIIMMVDNMSDEDAYLLASMMFYSHNAWDKEVTFTWTTDNYDKLSKRRRKKLADRWNRWKNIAGYAWKEKLITAQEIYLERQEKEETESNKRKIERYKAQLEIEKRRKKFYAMLIKNTKFLVTGLITAILCTITYLLGWLLLIVIYNWDAVLTVTIYVGIIVLGIGALIIVIKGIQYLLSKCNLNFMDADIARPFRFIGHVIRWPFMKTWYVIKSFGSFLVMYLKAFKEGNCPAIEWDNKDKSKEQ